MWLIGHLAVSFLICLPLLVYVRRERALALTYVGFFAVLPDFFHLGTARVFSHSLVGLAIILAFTLAVLAILFRPRPALLLIAVVASSGHLIADLYIGSIFPYYPFSAEWLQLHEFNGPFDIQVEVVLFTIATIILFLAFPPCDLLRSTLTYDRLSRANLLLLLLPLGTMIALEGAYFMLTSFSAPLSIGRLILLFYFAVTFLAVLIASLYVLVPSRDIAASPI